MSCMDERKAVTRLAETLLHTRSCNETEVTPSGVKYLAWENRVWRRPVCSSQSFSRVATERVPPKQLKSPRVFFSPTFVREGPRGL